MNSIEQQRAANVFTVLATGDVDLARRTVAPEFSNREADAGPEACSIPGPAGLLASSAWMRAAFDDLQFPITDSGFDGERVWVRLRMQGVQRRPFVQFHDGHVARVMPATGKRIDFEQIHMLRVGPGGIVRHEAVRDDLTMLQQLGAFPPSPGLMLQLVRGKLSGATTRAAREVTAAAADAAALA